MKDGRKLFSINKNFRRIGINRAGAGVQIGHGKVMPAPITQINFLVPRNPHPDHGLGRGVEAHAIHLQFRPAIRNLDAEFPLRAIPPGDNGRSPGKVGIDANPNRNGPRHGIFDLDFIDAVVGTAQILVMSVEIYGVPFILLEILQSQASPVARGPQIGNFNLVGIAKLDLHSSQCQIGVGKLVGKIDSLDIGFLNFRYHLRNANGDKRQDGHINQKLDKRHTRQRFAI